MKDTNNIDMAKLPSVLPKDYIIKSLHELHRNGLPKGYEVGIPELDKIARLDTGRLLTITGVPNYGKSEFVDFIAASLNRRYGLKTLYFSPENQPVNLHLSKLVSKYTGKPFEKDMPKEEIEQAAEYLSDNFYFFNYQKVSTLDDILKISEHIVDNQGVKIVVMDAYNKIESDIPSGMMETNFVSKILDRLCSFAIRKNVLVILVAHPRKMDGDGGKNGYKIPSAYDINGSANFYNKSDYILVVHRDFKRNDVIIKFDKVKFKNYGSTGEVRLKYDMDSGNYYYDDSDMPFLDEEDEEHTNLLPEPFKFPEVEVHDPLDVIVSLYQGATDNTGVQVNLKDFLFSDKYKSIAEEIRKGATPDERHEIKNKYKSQIPCITPSGLFSKRSKDHLTKATGLIGIDIDYKDNVEVMAQVPDILKQLPYVLYASKSISGDGYFALVQLATDDFKGHYLAIEKELKGYGITTDKSCKDITRLRFASYDDSPYYNPDATSYCLVEEDFVSSSSNQEGQRHTTSSSYTPSQFVSTADESLKRLGRAIEEMESSGCCIPDDYDTWFRVGCSCASIGEAGRSYFHRLSSTSSKYDSQECNEEFDKILTKYGSTNTASLGTAINIVRDAIKS